MDQIMRGTAMVLLATGWVLLAGCSSAGRHEYQTRRLTTSDYELAYEAALGAVRERFRINTQNAATGRIRTRAQRDVGRLGSASNRRVSEVIVPRDQNIRRTASVQIRRVPDGLVAACSVSVDRLDTEIFRTQHRRERESQDTPTDTPIDRGAGAGLDQQQRWTPAGRDRGMESKMLARIQQCVDELQAKRKKATTRETP